ncbi:LPS assembly lipoprotein LptE [Hydrocarboniclastica marina]|uniref:LPS-assembly lipoprotein LptE n=1 Tax=Hydrocarboniclastica marina TaxID=2259620 RepID=A0A4P7XHS4_9ALTE|nr:LPS assembly lipoprotein LptE [Hydrocarboniclastica marina]QCF26598.1 hypothetical protein soil367_12015 [Hydrocarboniclastica marina]
MRTNHNKPRHLIAVFILLSVALSACGFRLRGATAVPDALNPVFVDCAGNTPIALCEQVRELLELNEVTVVETARESSYTLRLTGLETSRRATAITDSAAAAEYDLRLQTRMSLFTPTEIPLLAQATISANEIYRYDEDNVLAKRREQRDLTEQLYSRLAQQIVFRLTPYTAERIQALIAEYEAAQAASGEAEVQAPDAP